MWWTIGDLFRVTASSAGADLAAQAIETAEKAARSIPVAALIAKVETLPAQELSPQALVGNAAGVPRTLRDGRVAFQRRLSVVKRASL